MSDAAAFNPPMDNQEDARAQEALVDQYLAEIKRLQQQMAADREEILRLQPETRAVLDDVMATLRAA